MERRIAQDLTALHSIASRPARNGCAMTAQEIAWFYCNQTLGTFDFRDCTDASVHSSVTSCELGNAATTTTTTQRDLARVMLLLPTETSTHNSYHPLIEVTTKATRLGVLLT